LTSTYSLREYERQKKAAKRNKAGQRASYSLVAIVLIYLGVTIFLISYFIYDIIPLAALGIASIVLGLSAGTIPDRVKSTKSVRIIFNSAAAGAEETIRSLKQLGIQIAAISNANSQLMRESPGKTSVRPIYLPPKNGLAAVYLPISGEPQKPLTVDQMWNAPNVLVNFTPSEQQNIGGILLYPIGAYIGSFNDIRGNETSLEEALRFVLIETTEVCSSLSLSESEGFIILALRDIKVLTSLDNYREVLGSFPASLAASVIATMRSQPVVIIDESFRGDQTQVRFATLAG
jgi:hypothetical protein